MGLKFKMIGNVISSSKRTADIVTYFRPPFSSPEARLIGTSIMVRTLTYTDTKF